MVKLEKSSPDLAKDVIYAGLCCHCGACGAYCSHMKADEETGRPINVDVCNEVVGLCYNSCPRTYMDLADQDMRTFGKVRENDVLGVYEKILIAEGKKPNEIIEALIKAALEKGLVEAAVMPQDNQKKPPNNTPVVVKDVADVGKYSPLRGTQSVGPIIQGINTAFQDGARKIALVGNPCHMQALKRQANSNFATPSDNVVLAVGLMCASAGLSGCKPCTDYTAEFADISVGPKGELIVRSEMGQKVLDASGLAVKELADYSKIENLARKKKVRGLLAGLGDKKALIGYVRLTGSQIKELFSQ